ncbi:MAG: VOC family protein [Perlucidibaca sp.]
MTLQTRIARPVTSPGRSAAMYREGLGLVELGRFADHEGFDGIMLGDPAASWHLEFTCCRHHPVMPSPTPEDLLVFDLPDAGVWAGACAGMLAAGFVEVEAFNPYWSQRGRTFADPDGYRVVLECDRWQV